MDSKEYLKDQFSLDITHQGLTFNCTCYEIPNIRKEEFLAKKRMVMAFLHEKSIPYSECDFVVHIAVCEFGVLSILVQEPIKKFIELLKQHGFNTKKVSTHNKLKDKLKNYLFKESFFYKDFFKEKKDLKLSIEGWELKRKDKKINLMYEIIPC